MKIDTRRAPVKRLLEELPKAAPQRMRRARLTPGAAWGYHALTTRIAEQRRLKPHARPGGMAACRRAVGAQRTDAP
jgi:hypothetical protein